MQLLAAKNVAQIMLPEFPRKTKFRVFPVQVDEKLDSQRAPQIQQRNVRFNRFQLDISIKIENLTFGKSVERIGIKMIAVRRIGRPIGIGVMRRD